MIKQCPKNPKQPINIDSVSHLHVYKLEDTSANAYPKPYRICFIFPAMNLDEQQEVEWDYESERDWLKAMYELGLRYTLEGDILAKKLDRY